MSLHEMNVQPSQKGSLPSRDNLLLIAQAKGRGISETHYWHYCADLMYMSSKLIIILDSSQKKTA